ncbi:MAG TPA: BtaA family protein [Gemmatales bacterium]|nr:BtaA family protein [Gemmatales bacterium]
MKLAARVSSTLSQFFFQLVHRHHLVYNTCWEDPRLDRVALALAPADRVVMITSAGCNALDYALDGPARIDCIDVNPRQNALLALKIAGIRALNHAEFFAVFGHGGVRDFRALYQDALRPHLTGGARVFWDRHQDFFAAPRSFYFRGAAGHFARAVNFYIDRVVQLREPVNAILRAPSLEVQRDIYQRHLRDGFWTRMLRWLINADAPLALLGVPRAQRQHLERTTQARIASFVEECLHAVFHDLPLADNYFWRVYLTGAYDPECCPEYLRPEPFARLKAGLVDRIHVHTAPLQHFLEQCRPGVTRFVLLDHMDWLSAHRRDWLQAEWQALVAAAAPGARLLWRSGGLQVDFVDDLLVRHRGRTRRVGDVLTYNTTLAQQLHVRDRVHTYGSFYIADLAV